MSFDIVKGSTLPAMDIDLDADTSTADSVELRWAKPDGTIYTSNLTVVNASQGQYKMEWGPDDTDTIGGHIGEVVVTTAGVIQVFPEDGSKYIWWVNPTVPDLVDS